MADDFTLQPPRQPDKRCGTCQHYTPQRNRETGRVLRAEPGRCGWRPASWPVLSDAFSTAQWGGSYAPSWPTPHGMHANMGSDCKMWERKKRDS